MINKLRLLLRVTITLPTWVWIILWLALWAMLFLCGGLVLPLFLNRMLGGLQA